MVFIHTPNYYGVTVKGLKYVFSFKTITQYGTENNLNVIEFRPVYMNKSICNEDLNSVFIVSILFFVD